MTTEPRPKSRTARSSPGFPVVSFLLLAAVGVLWVRSDRQADLVAVFTRAGCIQGVASHRGGVLLLASDLRFSDARRLTADYDHTPAAVFDEVRGLLRGSASPHGGLGFEFAGGAIDVDPYGPASAYHYAVVPYWFLALLTQVAPVRRWLRCRRAARRARRGQCVGCGYDLRGTVGGPCPECGAAAEARAT
jgi:hypothetical protein